MLRTASYSPPEKWKPKQCVPVTPSVFQEATGTSSQEFAKHIVGFLAPFSPGSVVHDNACGSGVVSKEVMAVSSSEAYGDQGITIHATDLSEAMVAECQTLAIERGWNAPPMQLTSQVMAMQDQTFPDKTFTHSITNFAMFALDPEDAAKAASHIYRTLQDNGVAVITVWAETATGDALQEAHQETRSTMAVLPLFSNAYWKYHSHIRKVLTEAGFSDDNITITKRSADIEVRDLDRWSNVMWTLVGRPKEGWQEGDEERWDMATARVREHCRQSKDFHTTSDGGCRIRNWANVIFARK